MIEQARAAKEGEWKGREGEEMERGGGNWIRGNAVAGDYDELMNSDLNKITQLQPAC